MASPPFHPARADDPEVARLCEIGARGDAALAGGDIPGALQAYDEVIRSMGKQIDLFLMGRATLGTLLAYLGQGDLQAAHRIWTAKAGQDGPHAIGVIALESPQVDARAQAIYSLVSAALYSQTAEAAATAAKGVNHHMKKAIAFARRHEPELLPSLVANWSLFMTTLYGPTIPWFRGRHLRRIAGQVQVSKIDRPVFPPPGPWLPPG